MKTIALLLGMLISSFIAKAQDSEGITISVTIENVMNSEGDILVALHSQDTFMKGLGIQNLKENAEKGEITFSFTNVQPGTYAISSLHDLNKNQQMDFEDNGMPKEDYAMSGSSSPMGPPTFEDVKFEVKEEDMELKLRF